MDRLFLLLSTFFTRLIVFFLSAIVSLDNRRRHYILHTLESLNTFQAWACKSLDDYEPHFLVHPAKT